jgi:hypothetical protein
LSCLCDQAKKLRAGGRSAPDSLIIAVHKEAALRHYQMALENLPPDDR